VTTPTEQWFNRSCPICEASCGLRVLAHPARREVLRIEGDPDDPRSRGHLCPKAYALKWVQEDPDRLRRPLRRTKSGFEEIAWEDAFDLAASELSRLRSEHGNDSIGVYIGNPSGFDIGSMVYTSFFMGALQTPRVFSGATMDHFPKLVSSRILYGKSAILPIPDIDHCDYFLCLGGNPLISQGSLMSAPDMRRRLRDLRARGGKVVVVDPRRTETARVADEHLFIKPGSDAYWLLSMVHVLFDEDLLRPGRFVEFTDGIDELRDIALEWSPETVEAATGVAPDVTRRITREFARSDRGCCYGRIGTCTVEYGMLASWLIDVIGILTGHFDTEGGMMFPRPATGQVEEGKGGAEFGVGRWRSVVRNLPEVDGQLPCAAMAEEIDAAGDRRMRGFVTVAGNPVLSTPNGARLDRAFAQLDFMVSVDIYLNETTRHANLILPTQPQLESENFDFLAASTAVRNYVRASERVFEPEPGTRPHWQVVLELAARLNGTTSEALERQVLANQAGRAVNRDGSPARGLSIEDAIARVSDEPGPMRAIDLMLRGGPFGDGFEDGAEGLSLEKVRAVRHAIDLGPLEPRLPGILRTPGRRIPLVHDYFLADFERLREGLRERSRRDGLVLVGRRQQRNMNSWLHNLEGLARGRDRCTLLVHDDDARRLGLRDGGEARIRSRVGEVVAPVEISNDMMPGVVSLPHGFGHTGRGTRTRVASRAQPGVNSNDLTDETLMDVPTGTSVANGIPVEVSAA
jgi:anaerobic selenocysteine-containing dehydrogenase